MGHDDAVAALTDSACPPLPCLIATNPLFPIYAV